MPQNSNDEKELKMRMLEEKIDQLTQSIIYNNKPTENVTNNYITERVIE